MYNLQFLKLMIASIKIVSICYSKNMKKIFMKKDINDIIITISRY